MYEAAFHHFKPDKYLRWLQNIGTAVVKLELEDRIIETEATPLQASIAELFEEQSQWMTADLGERLFIEDQAQIRNALAFWASHGLVKDEPGGWRILEIAEEEGGIVPGPCIMALRSSD